MYQSRIADARLKVNSTPQPFGSPDTARSATRLFVISGSKRASGVGTASPPQSSTVCPANRAALVTGEADKRSDAALHGSTTPRNVVGTGATTKQSCDAQKGGHVHAPSNEEIRGNNFVPLSEAATEDMSKERSPSSSKHISERSFVLSPDVKESPLGAVARGRAVFEAGIHDLNTSADQPVINGKHTARCSSVSNTPSVLSTVSSPRFSASPGVHKGDFYTRASISQTVQTGRESVSSVSELRCQFEHFFVGGRHVEPDGETVGIKSALLTSGKSDNIKSIQVNDETATLRIESLASSDMRGTRCVDETPNRSPSDLRHMFTKISSCSTGAVGPLVKTHYVTPPIADNCDAIQHAAYNLNGSTTATFSEKSADDTRLVHASVSVQHTPVMEECLENAIRYPDGQTTSDYESAATIYAAMQSLDTPTSGENANGVDLAIEPAPVRLLDDSSGHAEQQHEVNKQDLDSAAANSSTANAVDDQQAAKAVISKKVLNSARVRSSTNDNTDKISPEVTGVWQTAALQASLRRTQSARSAVPPGKSTVYSANKRPSPDKVTSSTTNNDVNTLRPDEKTQTNAEDADTGGIVVTSSNNECKSYGVDQKTTPSHGDSTSYDQDKKDEDLSYSLNNGMLKNTITTSPTVNVSCLVDLNEHVDGQDGSDVITPGLDMSVKSARVDAVILPDVKCNLENAANHNNDNNNTGDTNNKSALTQPIPV